MSVNAFSAALARETGYGYHDIRIAVNRLVNHAMWPREQAEEFVEDLAKDKDFNGDLADAVTQIVGGVVAE